MAGPSNSPQPPASHTPPQESHEIREPLENDVMQGNEELPTEPYQMVRRVGSDEVDKAEHVFQRFLSLSAQYPDLAQYLSIEELSRDERTDIPRLKKLAVLCEEHQVTGARVPVRAADKPHLREMQQTVGDRIHLTVEPFDPKLATERAINGLITRAVKAVTTPGLSTIDVERSLTEDEEALTDLQKAVSARIRRQVRIDPMGVRLTDNGPSHYLWVLGQ